VFVDELGLFDRSSRVLLSTTPQKFIRSIEDEDLSSRTARLASLDQPTVSHCKGVRCPPIFSLSNLIDAGWL